MAFFPLFLSVVFIVRNQSEHLETMLSDAINIIVGTVSDFEIVVVDNASDDNSIDVLKRLTGVGSLPNLQVYALTKEVDLDTASWAGMENALGDFVVVADPSENGLTFLSDMLERAVSGNDVVFATNQVRQKNGLVYGSFQGIFNRVYAAFTGVHLTKEAPLCRILSRRVVNFVLQHPQPAFSYRHLPATAGFSRANLEYRAESRFPQPQHLMDGVDRGMRLLVSSTRAPMRLVTALALFGAAANLTYSIYVLFVAFFKTDVAAGWVSLSLQQSGMFFLISLVLLVLGEYILQMASLSNEGPLYHVAQEFTSADITRRSRLNVDEAGNAAESPKESVRQGT